MASNWPTYVPPEPLFEPDQTQSCPNPNISPPPGPFQCPEGFDGTWQDNTLSTSPHYYLNNWATSDHFTQALPDSQTIEQSGMESHRFIQPDTAAFIPESPNTYHTTSIRSQTAGLPTPASMCEPSLLPRDFEPTAPNLQPSWVATNLQYTSESYQQATEAPTIETTTTHTVQTSSSPASPAGLEPASASPPTTSPQPAPERTQKKRLRSRPTHTRRSSAPASSASPSSSSSPTPPSTTPRPSKRQPHNEVERKYRDGLNASLERLRRTVPTLHQDAGSSGGPQQRPSKATVLARAREYIEFCEAERERLRAENGALWRLRGEWEGAAGMEAPWREGS